MIPADRLRGAHGNTLAAVDTLVVAHVLHVHFAHRNAFPAVGAVVLVDSHADEGDFVEEAVNGAEGAEETAEETEDKD